MKSSVRSKSESTLEGFASQSLPSRVPRHFLPPRVHNVIVNLATSHRSKLVSGGSGDISNNSEG
jgi:hypothetical protein